MSKLQSKATLISYANANDGRHALILDIWIQLYLIHKAAPTCGHRIITVADFGIKFDVLDVRSKNGIVFHYRVFKSSGGEFEMELEKGKEVSLCVDESRRKLNSRLHSAGHLLDVCMQNIGLGHLEPSKGYHFPDGPYVEYKGTVAQDQSQSKAKELEVVANSLISRGGKVSVSVLPYDRASELCGGCLPS